MISSAYKTFLQVARQCLRIDITIAIILLIFSALVVPCIPRATANANMLSVFIDDELPLTMGMDSMAAFPFWNPARYYAIYGQIPPIPSYFSGFIYSAYGIYGGLQFQLALLFYLPLKWLGAGPFPLEPILLRIVSFAGGAISLLVLYNFARRYAGYFAALFATVFVLTDSYFIYYSSIIHPDSLQMGLALFALALAVRHTEDGSYGSLIALGFADGLVQGTKFGGPWMIPMSLLALAWAMRTTTYPTIKAFAVESMWRLLLLGAASIAAFFLTTPCAFLDSYYITAWRLLAHMILVPGALQNNINFFSWIDGLIAHHGMLWAVSTILALVLLAFRSVQAPRNAALILSAVLGASNVLWYSLMGKLWVELGYMLVGFALSALLVGEALTFIKDRVAKVNRNLTPPLVAVQLAALILTIDVRWFVATSVSASNLSWRSATAIKLGDWASANLPHGSRIMQVHGYFNPQDFPDQRLLGLISYPDLQSFRPNYFVLSSSVYDADWYRAMRKTQDFGRDVQSGSVRLYQDLLNARADPNQLGPTGIPGISLLYRAANETGVSKYCNKLSSQLWFIGRDTASGVGGICTQLRLAFGYESRARGADLMLYKLDITELQRFLDSPEGKQH